MFDVGVLHLVRWLHGQRWLENIKYSSYLLLQCQLDDSVVASKYYFFSPLWNYLCRFVENDEVVPLLLCRLGNIVLMTEFEGPEE